MVVFGNMMFCYEEELTVHFIYIPDFVVINTLHHQKVMRKVLGLILTKWCVPPPLLVHF